MSKKEKEFQDICVENLVNLNRDRERTGHGAVDALTV